MTNEITAVRHETLSPNTWLVAYGTGGAWSGYQYASIVVADSKDQANDYAGKMAVSELQGERRWEGISYDVEHVQTMPSETALYASRLKPEARAMVDIHWSNKDAVLKHWSKVLGMHERTETVEAPVPAPASPAVVSSQAAANAYLLAQYEWYVRDVAEGDPMELDDWIAGSDIPEIVRARNVSRGIQCVGMIWHCADNMAEAKQWESDLLAKGAMKVELKPEDDRPIVDVIVTLDCCKANEILGYDVESHEWMEEDPESESAAQVQGVDDSAIQAERPRER